jgi:hypothetical protein
LSARRREEREWVVSGGRWVAGRGAGRRVGEDGASRFGPEQGRPWGRVARLCLAGKVKSSEWSNFGAERLLGAANGDEPTRGIHGITGQSRGNGPRHFRQPPHEVRFRIEVGDSEAEQTQTSGRSARHPNGPRTPTTEKPARLPKCAVAPPSRPLLDTRPEKEAGPPRRFPCGL